MSVEQGPPPGSNTKKRLQWDDLEDATRKAAANPGEWFSAQAPEEANSNVVGASVARIVQRTVSEIAIRKGRVYVRFFP